MFIVFEGIDGCGKGTQADKAVAHLKDSFGSCTYIKYPDRTTPLGRIINEWLGGRVYLAKNEPSTGYSHSDLDPMAMQGLLLANKVETQPRLLNALKYGHVVADRYSPSAISYGVADGLSEGWLRESHSALLQPDLTILMDIPVEVSFQRRPKRQEAYEANENRLRGSRQMYLRQAKHDPKKWFVVDGTRSVDEIARDIQDVIHHLYAESV